MRCSHKTSEMKTRVYERISACNWHYDNIHTHNKQHFPTDSDQNLFSFLPHCFSRIHSDFHSAGVFFLYSNLCHNREQDNELADSDWACDLERWVVGACGDKWHNSVVVAVTVHWCTFCGHTSYPINLINFVWQVMMMSLDYFSIKLEPWLCDCYGCGCCWCCVKHVRH